MPEQSDEIPRRINVSITESQLRMLQLLEKEGLSDPERVHILADMVKQAAAWGYLRRWLIQIAAVAGAGGVIWGVVQALRSFGQGGPQ